MSETAQAVAQHEANRAGIELARRIWSLHRLLWLQQRDRTGRP